MFTCELHNSLTWDIGLQRYGSPEGSVGLFFPFLSFFIREASEVFCCCCLHRCKGLKMLHPWWFSNKKPRETQDMWTVSTLSFLYCGLDNTRRLDPTMRAHTPATCSHDSSDLTEACVIKHDLRRKTNMEYDQCRQPAVLTCTVTRRNKEKGKRMNMGEILAAYTRCSITLADL